MATQLAFALEQPPERIEAGLVLALELCDSTLAYRARYLSVVQPALVLDLVLADEGNPRGLGISVARPRARSCACWTRVRAIRFPAMLDAPVADMDYIVAELTAAEKPGGRGGGFAGAVAGYCRGNIGFV